MNQLDPIILDLGKSAMPQETCESRTLLSSKNMGMLVLLVLALFLTTSKIMIWPEVVFSTLFITYSPPTYKKVMKRPK